MQTILVKLNYQPTDKNLEQDMKTNKRQYPKFYEKTVPIAIGLIVLINIGMLVFALGVVFGLI